MPNALPHRRICCVSIARRRRASANDFCKQLRGTGLGWLNFVGSASWSLSLSLTEDGSEEGELSEEFHEGIVCVKNINNYKIVSTYLFLNAPLNDPFI